MVAVMATVAKGYDLDYAWRAVAEAYQGAGYYLAATEAGEPPGTWWGPGAELLGLEMGQQVEREPYALLFGERKGPDVLERVDALTAQTEALTQRIDEVIVPFAHQVAQLDEVPGIGKTGAQELIAEIGVDMTRFPTAGHLVSWAKYAPKAKQSAGKSKPGTTRKGNPWIASALGEAGIGAARTKTFLGSRYHRLARRRGKQRALVAVGNSILTIAWRLLSDPDARFTGLGPDWHDRIAPLRRTRQLIAELERLSEMKVTLQDAA